MVKESGMDSREAGKRKAGKTAEGNPSEAKDLEAALRECERSLSRIQTLTHLGDWKMDLETMTGYGSDEFYRILGISRVAALSLKEFEARVHPDDRSAIEKAIADTVNERRMVERRYRIVRPDGTVRHVLSAGDFSEEAGRQILFGTIQDITEQVQLEQSLRESEQSFINTFEASPVPTVICRQKDEHYVAVNRAFEIATGYSRDDALGKTTDELQLTIVPGMVPRLLEEISRGGSVYNREIAFQGKDKNQIIGLASIIPFVFRHQRCYLFVGIDINDRKRAEEALRDSEKSFITVFEASPAITLISTREEGLIVTANRAFEEASGYRRDAAIGKTSEELGLFSRHDQREALLREIDEKRGVYNREIVIRGADGREVIGLTSVLPITFKQQECLLFVGIDITERKKAEEALRRNEYELKTIVDNTPDIYFRLDRHLKYIYVNPAYEKLTGLMKEQFVGKTNNQLGMPRHMVDLWQSAAREVLESGKEYNVEFAITGFFGKRYFAARLIPEFERSGLVDTILVVARDITDRKRVEEELARR